MSLNVLMRGGGDLASGVAIRLYRAGWRVLITELPQPLAVRRLVAFSQAVYTGEICIEEVRGRLAADAKQALQFIDQGSIAVLVDPPAASRAVFHPDVIIDGRMTKQSPGMGIQAADMVIGLGPGFCAGEDCHAVIETIRGPSLGRVIWSGQAEPDTGIPERVGDRQAERVLRAPCDGHFKARAEICDLLEAGQVVAEVNGCPIKAPFHGLLRGLIQSGVEVQSGMKVGDIDPRLDPRLCVQASDKALAIAGGVMEAILSRVDLRPRMWTDNRAAG